MFSHPLILQFLVKESQKELNSTKGTSYLNGPKTDFAPLSRSMRLLRFNSLSLRGQWHCDAISRILHTERQFRPVPDTPSAFSRRAASLERPIPSGA